MKHILIFTVMSFALTACSSIFGEGERGDMKSPCVGIEDSPCGPKRSVNNWWLA